MHRKLNKARQNIKQSSNMLVDLHTRQNIFKVLI